MSYDFKLAKIEPNRPYDPHSEDSSTVIDKTGRRTQGIVRGKLDQILDLFIAQEVVNNTLRKRIISYGEFESQYPELRKLRKLDMAIELFTDFHPASKPILWRILIAQAILFNSILAINEVRNESKTSIPIIDFSYEQKLDSFDWRTGEEEAMISEEEILTPFIAAFNYFNKDNHLKKLISM